jgi:hypothetical protein
VQVTDPATGDRLRRTAPTLAAGASTTLNVSVRAPAPGPTNLTVATTYTTPTGAEATTAFTRSVSVAPLADDVGVRVERAQADDTQQQVSSGIAGILGGGGGGALQPQAGGDSEVSESAVDVTVTNFGNAAVEDVVVAAQRPNGSLLGSVGRFAGGDRLAPGEPSAGSTGSSSSRATTSGETGAASSRPSATTTRPPPGTRRSPGWT